MTQQAAFASALLRDGFFGQGATGDCLDAPDLLPAGYAFVSEDDTGAEGINAKVWREA